MHLLVIPSPPQPLAAVGLLAVSIVSPFPGALELESGGLQPPGAGRFHPVSQPPCPPCPSPWDSSFPPSSQGSSLPRYTAAGGSSPAKGRPGGFRVLGVQGESPGHHPCARFHVDPSVQPASPSFRLAALSLTCHDHWLGPAARTPARSPMLVWFVLSPPALPFGGVPGSSQICSVTLEAAGPGVGLSQLLPAHP